MGEGSHHGPGYYIKIWAALLVLLVISVAGPEVAGSMRESGTISSGSALAIVLITAFGIAIVKALMVAAYFMHLNIEKRYIWYIMYTMLIFDGLFLAGTSPDVMNTSGTNWENKAALEEIERATKKDQGSDH